MGLTKIFDGALAPSSPITSAATGNIKTCSLNKSIIRGELENFICPKGGAEYTKVENHL